MCWFSLCLHNLNASAFRRRRHYVFGLSVRPSEAWNTLFPPVHGSTRPTVTVLWHVRPSVRPERFPGICRRTHGGNGLIFCKLMYLDHLRNWFVYGHSLSIFLIFGTILTWWLLIEKAQILCLCSFSGKCMEGMAWNLAYCCILTTLRTVVFK